MKMKSVKKARKDDRPLFAAVKHWEEVRGGLDDDRRDDTETYSLVVDSFRAGWEAALEQGKK